MTDPQPLGGDLVERLRAAERELHDINVRFGLHDGAALIRRAELACREAATTIEALRSELAELKAEAVEVVEPFAEAGRGLERRGAGGWRRVDRFGAVEVILDVTFSDLAPFERAASFLSRLKGEKASGEEHAGDSVK